MYQQAKIVSKNREWALGKSELNFRLTGERATILDACFPDLDEKFRSSLKMP